MTLLQRLLARLPGPIVTGHPCLYDALDIAARDVAATSYLEIGVLEGASLLAVLAAAPAVTRLVLCDEWGGVDNGTSRGSHDHIESLLDTVGYCGERWYLDGDSRATVPTIPAATARFDLISVDGNHSADAAATDLANVWPLLRPGGILVMDDIGREHLRMVWDAFVVSRNAERIYELDDGGDRTAIARKREASA